MPRPKGYFDRTPKITSHGQMMARLQELTGAPPNPPTYRDEPDREVKPITASVQLPSIASGPAGQEAGEVRGVPPAGKTPIVQLPMGYDPKADPPALEWFKPVQHPNGEATQTSAGGAYAVFGRRTPQGFAYIARHGLDALGVSRESAQNAREMCERHFMNACGEPP